MSKGAKAKTVQKAAKPIKKSIEGRTTQISLDIYERAKKDAKYRKMTVDQYLDSLLREVVFKPAKSKGSKKQDLIGYCPNCDAIIKHSTIKATTSKTPPSEEPKTGASFFSKFFGKNSD